MTVAILLLGFFLLLLMGVPVAFCVGLAALGAVFSAGIPAFVIFQRMFGGVDSFTLLAIPFFIFMGNIMDTGGIARRIVGFANIIIGQIRGGLAAVNVLASMFFAGISGSAVADTSSIGAMLIPMMYEEGYDKGFTVAITCTSSTIGLIIPPSNTMILYSFVAGGVSIADLFAAGVVPGVLVGLGLIAVSFVISVKHNYPRHPRPSMKEAVRITREALLSLVIVAVIVGGILGGVCTATEAAVFGVVYALILTIFVYKELKPKDLPRVMLNTVYTTAIVIFLIGTSTAFSYVMTAERVPVVISGFLTGLTDNKYVLLLLLNALLLVVGMIMDMSPAVLIFTPILLPIAMNLGMSNVQFGIMLLVNLCIGCVTPPVGGVLFVGLGIGKLTIPQVLKPLLMFIAPMFIVVLLVTYFEPVTMVLPRLLFGRG
jgi:tripartite ATP-independent transporter DctM subunit